MIEILTLAATLAVAKTDNKWAVINVSTKTYQDLGIDKPWRINVFGPERKLIMTCDQKLDCKYDKKDSAEIIKRLLIEMCRFAPGGCRNYP